MIDRKYFGLARVAAIVFAAVVVLFVLVDFLAFGGEGVSVRVDLKGAQQVWVGDSVVLRVPVVIKNTLPVDFTSEDVKVVVNGNSVTPEGEGDSLFIPVVFDFSDEDGADTVSLGVDFEAGFLYRGWSGNWKGTVTPEEVLGDLAQRTADEVGSQDRVKGRYLLKGNSAVVTIDFTNPYDYPVGVEFDGDPLFTVGNGKSRKGRPAQDSLKLAGKGKGSLNITFALDKEWMPKDGKQFSNASVRGDLVITVMNKKVTRNREIVLSVEEKEPSGNTKNPTVTSGNKSSKKQ